MPRLRNVLIALALALAFMSGESFESPKSGNTKQAEAQDQTRIFEAIAAGDKEQLAELLGTVKDIDIRNDHGYTLLHWAVLTKQEEIASLLIARGAKIATTLPNGYTPLHDAVFTGNRNIVQILIDRGADLYAADQNRKRPLDLAVEFGRPELIPLLKPLHRAADEGDFDKIKRIVQSHPGQINAKDESGLSPLHLAAGRDHLEIVKFLVEKGADLQARGPWGKTPLRTALDHGQGAVSRYLQEKGARDQSDDLLLREKLRDREAVIWYLFHTGWAVKTKNHFLVFDYVPRDNFALSPFIPSCLSSGDIDPRQIRDQNVVVFVPIVWDRNHVRTLLSWKKEIKDLTFIVGEKKFTDPAAVYIEPRRRKTIKDLEILPIGTTGYGEAFVVKADGLTFFFGGDHESSEQSRDLFSREIDFVGDQVQGIDILFLQMIFEEQYRSSLGVFYALEKLKPAMMFPTSAIAAAPFYQRFLREATAKGLADKIRSAGERGDLFFFPSRF